jgi:two-component system, OmpR family, response regulator
MKNSILLIEDDSLVRQTIVSILTEDGYNVTCAHTIDEASIHYRNTIFDAILLDLQLPDGNGLELIHHMRAKTNAPILIISGRTDTLDKIAGLEMGADDYIAKPIQLKEMSARIKAQIRKYKTLTETNNTHAKNIHFNNYILDRSQMQVFLQNGENINLTTREYKLIEVLVLAPKQVHTREQLLNKVRTDNFDITDRAVDVQLLRIRRKMKEPANKESIIKSIRSVGYMLNCTTQSIY